MLIPLGKVALSLLNVAIWMVVSNMAANNKKMDNHWKADTEPRPRIEFRMIESISCVDMDGKMIGCLRNVTDDWVFMAALIGILPGGRQRH